MGDLLKNCLKCPFKSPSDIEYETHWRQKHENKGERVFMQSAGKKVSQFFRYYFEVLYSQTVSLLGDVET